MCGISGIIGDQPAQQLKPVIARMTDALVHRGPDAGGVFVEHGVALGHRRLSIIDLTDSGAQPMTLGRTTIVYNGECYNFRELRDELTGLGRSFRGHSDTEVVLQAYEQWGLDGLDRLEGIFGFALWDGARRRAVLMRDRLGIKPLFYRWQGGTLTFGSEIKAILASGDVDRDIDDQALMEYLWYGNAFEDRTIFRDVRAVTPGHRIIIEDGQFSDAPWWQVEDWLAVPAQANTLADATAKVREALDAAVERQLVSDVPVCVFLSGGIDSSAIAAAAVARGASDLSSYAVGFDFAGGVNELPKARQVAEHLGLNHRELQVRGRDLETVIQDLVTAHDEPFGDAANIPLYLLAKELRGSVKVALQGDGGDEMFAGYRRYQLLDNVNKWRYWPHAIEPVLRSLPGHYGRRLARLGASVGCADPALRMALLLTTETLDAVPTSVLTSDARTHLETSTDPFAAYRRCAERFAGADPVQKMLLTDMTLQLPSQFLAKVDRATMAQGLEARVPLLDEKVGSLAVGLPTAYKIAAGQRKIALRDASRQRLPAAILDGPKTGFGVPYGGWIGGALHDFARDAILDQGFVQRLAKDRPTLVSMLDAHRQGRGAHGFTLWKLLNLALWSRTYLGAT